MSVDNANILSIKIVLKFYAMLAIEPMLNQLMLKIYLIEDSIRIWFLTSSKRNDFKMLSSAFEKTQSIRSDRNVPFLLIAVRNINFYIVCTASFELAME